MAVASALIATLMAALAPPAGAATTTTTTTTTTAPATTTTTAPATTPATVPATTTTPTTAPTPTSAPPGTGVPKVPTGGGGTTVPPNPAAPPPAAPDAGPIVAAVVGDLKQLVAIDSVAQARAAVASSQQQLAAAHAVEARASHDSETGAQRQQAANASLAVAEGRMSGVAVAAYTGETSGVEPGPQSGDNSTTLNGTTGQSSVDATFLLELIFAHAKQGEAAARQQLANVSKTAGQQSATLAQAGATVAAAQQLVAATQQNLTTTLRAAIVPGSAASTVAVLPGGVAAISGAASPATNPSEPTGSPTILGPPAATAAELAGWFSSGGHVANATVPIAQLAADYLAAGQQTGVRGDIAFAQSINETGFFGFPAGGQLTAADNNFAGIGACDSCAHGYSFPDAMTGVTAQEQLLESYASTKPVANSLIGNVGVGGCCTTWTALAGTWASNKAYGIDILTIYKQILDWLLPGRLAAAGLSAPPAPAP